MLFHLVFYIVNISHKCASRLINIKSTFPYRADIGSMSEYRCRFPISGRYRADIYNCTVKFFSQLLSIQWIINVNPCSLLYCKHITQVCQPIDQHSIVFVCDLQNSVFYLRIVHPWLWIQARRDLESNGDTRELKKINLLSGNFMYLLNTFICLY